MSEFLESSDPKGDEDEVDTSAGAVPDEVAAMFDLSQKKKKKKKKATETSTAQDNTESKDGESSDNVQSGISEVTDPPKYSYQQLLERVTDFLHQNNPELQDKKRHTVKPPQLMRVGTKKTLWANFQEICKGMRRNPEHVFAFMMAELGTEGSIDGNQRLLIRGKFVPKYIESLLRKYIVEYVTCQMCRSFNTSLTRDSVSRLYFVHCQDCGSSRSVAAIRAGYHAQTRADRRALRK